MNSVHTVFEGGLNARNDHALLQCEYSLEYHFCVGFCAEL